MQGLRQEEARTDLFPWAAPGCAAGSCLATDHLLAMRARRVARVGGVKGFDLGADRMSGCLAALARAGLPPTILPGRASHAFGRLAAAILTDPTFDAAPWFNDQAALGVLSDFAASGRDFRHSGFDDIKDFGQVFSVLTTVRCSIAGFGGQIAAQILDWPVVDRHPDPVTQTGVDLVIPALTTGV